MSDRASKRLLLASVLLGLLVAAIGPVLMAGRSSQRVHRSPSTDLVRPSAGPARPPATIRAITPTATLPAATTVLALSGPTPVSASPGGPELRSEPGIIYGAVETLPVLATRGGWALVLEPGPPNGQSGWVRIADGSLQSDPWFLVVDLHHRVITAHQGGHAVLSAPAAVGAPRTPTPQPPGDLTFISGDISTTGADLAEAPALRPLALHVSGAEAQVDDASVGADLVAIHGWEDRQNDPAVWGSTSGLAVSHACVRVPANFAAGPLSAVPNGTLHLLDQ